MCDYSLHNVKTRPAKVSDKLRYPQLWHWHEGLLCIGRSQRGCMRSTWTGAWSFADEDPQDQPSQSVARRDQAQDRDPPIHPTKTTRRPITTRWNSRTVRL